MNGFERHSIQHLSASSINLWSNAPDVWVMGYLFGQRTPAGPAAWRGICTEDAVVATLSGESEETAIANALAKFDKKYLIGDEDTLRERNRIGPMTQIAVAELKQYGEPEMPLPVNGQPQQHKVSITARGDGWAIPVIGYLDMVFPKHGLIVDLKTTSKVPTRMSPEHQLQRAIYAEANGGNMAVKFLYSSEKKCSMLEDGDPTNILSKAKVQITRIEAFLRLLDKEDAKAIVPVNAGSFYWSGNEQLRKEFYGL